MIYKILRAHEWDEAQKAGMLSGSPDDKRDGFIHFSAAHQTRATHEKYFAGQSGLVLLTVDDAKLGPALKWETSRGGDQFPHLYAALPLASVARADVIGTDANGRAILPPEIP